MSTEIQTKKSFGTINIDHFSPPISKEIPRAINVVLSFEEALKLHLGLLQILGKLNTYNRNTVAGKAAAIDLCIFTDHEAITITENKLAQIKPKKKA